VAYFETAYMVRVSAPGRLDFLNTHQDYKGLPVVSIAVNLRAYLTAAEGGGKCVVSSRNTGDVCEFEVGERPRGRGFCDYMKAAVLAVGARRCFRGELYSQIPIGAGMASSAAILVTAVAALLKLNGASPSLYDVAELAYVAEREVLGVPCGRLDQYGSAFGHVSLIYPTPPVKVERLELPGGVFVVLHSGISHSTAEVHTKRQEELQRAVELLKEWLRVEASGYWDFPWRALLSHRDVVDQLPEPLRSRVLFTLKMEKSTEEAVAVLKSEMSPLEKLKRVGEVMTQQHWLLSKLYEVSLPQLDLLVERALAAGAYGAKLSGAGLGGVVIALAPDIHTAQRIVKEAEAPSWWIVEVDRGLEYGD